MYCGRRGAALDGVPWLSEKSSSVIGLSGKKGYSGMALRTYEDQDAPSSCECN